MFGIDTKYGQILKSAGIIFAIAITVLLVWSGENFYVLVGGEGGVLFKAGWKP